MRGSLREGKVEKGDVYMIKVDGTPVEVHVGEQTADGRWHVEMHSEGLTTVHTIADEDQLLAAIAAGVCAA